MGQNRGQEVRVNGPMGAAGQMRMDVGFPGQPGPGTTDLSVFEICLSSVGTIHSEPLTQRMITLRK